MKEAEGLEEEEEEEENRRRRQKTEEEEEEEEEEEADMSAVWIYFGFKLRKADGVVSSLTCCLLE